MSLIRPCRLQYIMHTLVFYTTYDDIRDQHSFPTRRSSDLFLRKVDETIEDVIRYNFESDPDDKIFEKLLFKKATALFHQGQDRKSTRLNSSHVAISYAVFCLKKKIKKKLILRYYVTEIKTS